MSKKNVYLIEPPKDASKAEQRRYMAQLRGEYQVEQPKMKVGRFLIISLIIMALLAGVLVFCNTMLNIIENNAVVSDTGEVVEGEEGESLADVLLEEEAEAVQEMIDNAAASGNVFAAIGATIAQSVESMKATLLNTSPSVYLVGRVVSIALMIIYGLYALVKILQPKRRKPNRSFWGDVGIYAALFAIAIAMAFPLIFSVASSLKPLDELFRFPPKVFPQHVTFDNFSDLITTMGQSYVPFFRYLTNTVFITFIGTFGHVVIASMAAFVLAKYDFPGGKTFFSIVVTALMFSGYVTGIPNYVIMSRMKMIDTYWAVILPAFAAPIGLFLMKQFMEGLPTSLIEAAHIDGAGEFRIFWSIVMPNVKPAWLTIIIFSVQSLWNTNAATVIYSESKKTLVYALQQIQAGGIARTGQAAAVTVIVMLVPITIFILSQSRILETMASSGLKD